MNAQKTKVPLSVPRTSRAFQIPEPTLRAWLRRKMIQLEEVVPGAWMLLTARDATALLLTGAARAAGFRGLRIARLWDLVRGGFQEADKGPIKPYLVVNPRGGWVDVLCVTDGGTPRFPSPTRCYDLLAIAGRFQDAIDAAPATPAEAEKAFLEVVQTEAPGREGAPEAEEAPESAPEAARFPGLTTEELLKRMTELGQPVTTEADLEAYLKENTATPEVPA